MILIVSILLVTLAYVGLILSLSIGLKKVLSQEVRDNDPSLPISVIVAFKDEALNLTRLLKSLMNQSFPKDKFELILVNDHSSDSYKSTIEHYCILNSNFRLIDLPEGKTGKKAAIAFGIESANNPLIALTDADCMPNENWLKSISNEAGKGSALILGPVIMDSKGSWNGKFQSLEYASLMASAAGSCGIGHPIIASSANLAFRNDLLRVNATTLNLKVTSGDDMFLLHHVKKVDGCKISFMASRDAIVKTSATTTLGKAMNQRKRWASKSVYYDDTDTIITGFIVLAFNLTMIMLLVLAIFNVKNLYYFLVLFIIKSFVDIILLWRYLSFVEQKELLKVFLPLQLLYPIYIGYSFFAGIFTNSMWKGRSIR